MMNPPIDADRDGIEGKGREEEEVVALVGGGTYPLHLHPYHVCGIG